MANHGLGWIEGMTAMLYLKHDQAGDFQLHPEQGLLPFINYGHSGTGIWYGIPQKYEPQLVQFTNHIGHKYGIVDEGCDLCIAPSGCAKAFLRARCLMPDPLELVNDFGVGVERFEQEAGDVMTGHGFCYHMGTNGTGTVETEAIIAAPVWWLRDGLPELFRLVKMDLNPYMKLYFRYQARPRQTRVEAKVKGARAGAAVVHDRQDEEHDDDESIDGGLDDTVQFRLPRGITAKVAELLFSEEIAVANCRLIPIAWFRGFARVVSYHLRASIDAEDEDNTTEYEYRPAEAGMDFDMLLRSQQKRAEQLLTRLLEWFHSYVGQRIP